jgi:cytidylate kinase
LKFSVAIDGPAGAGKSTIAKILAKKLELMYINTGAMYRALTLEALETNISSDNVKALCELLESLTMTFKNDRLYLNGVDVNDELNLPNISQNVSKYASIREIRQKLVKMQRELSYENNVIMDGRDIGTVVLKDAPYKFFLTASPEVRAERRYEELKNKGLNVEYKDILADMIQRDYEDTHRQVDPLSKAEDAVEVNCTELNIDETVEFLYNYIIENNNVR